MEHGYQQRFGGMGADDLAPEPGIDELRHPADMIDVRMGQKHVVYFVRLNRKLVKGQLRVMTICLAAVHKDIYAVG